MKLGHTHYLTCMDENCERLHCVQRREYEWRNGMSRYGNWHTKSHKKPVAISVGDVDPETLIFLGQVERVHKELGRDGVIKFLRVTEERDELPRGSLNDFLAMVGVRVP